MVRGGLVDANWRHGHGPGARSQGPGLWGASNFCSQMSALLTNLSSAPLRSVRELLPQALKFVVIGEVDDQLAAAAGRGFDLDPRS